MKFKFTYLLILILSLSLGSCNPASKFKTEIAEIDSCLAVLDTIEQNFDGIEFDSLQMIVDHVNENEKFIKKNYFSDTINQSLASNLNSCKGIRKFFNSPSADRNNLKQEIIDLNTQLENLKEDILNGILKKEKIDLYISNEESDLNLFNRQFIEYYDKQKVSFLVYYKIVPEIDAFILEMKSTENEIED